MNSVAEMKVAADGKIYVGGNGLNPGDTGLRRLYSNGALDGSFVAGLGAGSGIHAVLLLPSGTVLAGGFTKLESVGYNGFLAALTPTGQIDTTFMAAMGSGPDGYAGYELLEAPDGKILVASRFGFFDGQSRIAIARLFPDGSIDNSFAPLPYTGVGTTNSDFLTHFYCAAYQPDGKIVAGGWFDRVSDPNLETFNLTRFEGDAVSGPGTVRWTATTVDTAEGNTVTLTATRFGGLTGAVSVGYATSNGVAVSGSDYTAASGSFAWAAGEGGSKSVVITTLQDTAEEGNESFTVDLSAPTGGVTIAPGQGTATVTIQDDDSAPVFVLQPQSTTGIATLSITLIGAASHALPITYRWFKDGGTTHVASGSSFTVSNLQPSSAGSYVLRATITDPQSGLPRSVDSSPAVLTVVEPPGSRDLTWTPGTGFNNTVSKIYHLPDGSMLAGGLFTQYSAATANYLAKLSPSGVLISPWPVSGTGPNNEVRDIFSAAAGKFLLAGSFTTYNSVNQRGIARINADGTLDTGFVRTTTGTARVVRELSDGSILGGFDGLGLRKFSSTGVELASFQPFGSVTTIYDMVVLSDGKIIVAAQRTSGTRSGTVYRLLPDLTVDPNFNLAIADSSNAYLYQIAVDSEGRIYMAGGFITVDGSPRSNVARLNPDGTLDDTYLPNVNSAIYSMLVQDDGRLVLGGYFSFVDGVSRNRIARLLPDSRLDTGFFPGTAANDSVWSVSRSPLGELYIGGAFSTFSGAAAGRIARLKGDFGSIQFDKASLAVNEQDGTATVRVKRLTGNRGAASVQYQRNGGSAVAGTDFTGATSGTLTWADGDTSDRDLVFNITNNGSADGTRTLTLQLFNAIYPVELGGIASTTLTILDDESLATVVSAPQPVTVPEANPASFSVSVSSATAVSYQWLKNGNPIAGAISANYTISSTVLANSGNYSVRITNGAGNFDSPTAALTVLKSPTAISAGWAPAGPGAATLNGVVRAILPLPNGGALVGGDFSLPQRGIVRINASGALVSSFTVALDSTAVGTGVHDIMMDGEGRIYISGRWDSIAGKSYANLVRLHPDFTIDDSFAAVLGSGPNGLVRDVTLDTDGGILIGGSFTRVSNLPGTAGFASISENGGIDRTLVSLAGGDIYRIARVPGSDKIWIAGSIVNYMNGKYIFLLNADGTRSPAFNNNSINGVVRDFVIREGGGVVIAGAFTGNLVALGPYGPVDPSFIPSAAINGAVNSVAIQPNGKFAAGGAFTNFGGAANRFARVTADGKIDSTLNLGSGFGGEVIKVVAGPDGRLWIGGNFSQFKGATANYLVRLHGDDVEAGILSQPLPQQVVAGNSAIFSVNATGTPASIYQWFKNGVLLANGGNISGATTASLQVANAQAADEANYSVRVSAGTTQVTSQAVSLRVVAAYQVDSITSGGEFPVGRRFILSATGAGAGVLSYQWKKGVADVLGATSPVLVLPAPTTADSGSYTLEVTNTFGTSVSPIINLTFIDPAPAAIRHIPLATGGAGGSTIYPIPDGRFFIGSSSGVNLYNTAGVQTTLPTFNGKVSQVLRQADGGFLVAGQFTQVGGQSAKWLARLTPDLILDTDFQAKLGTFNGSGGFAGVARVVELPDRGIVATGSFTDLNGAAGTTGLVKLHRDGSRDSGLVSAASNPMVVACLEYDAADSTVLLGGFGSLYGGANKLLHRIRLDGSRVASFNIELGGSGSLFSIALQPDRKILLGGDFTSVQGVNRTSLARINADGSLDTSFTTQSGTTSSNGIGKVASIGLETDGDIVVVGNFPSLGGIGQNDILRLRPDGSIDSRFDPGFGLDGNGSRAESVAVGADGSIFVTGSVLNYNDVTINDVVILQGDRIPLAFAALPAWVEAVTGETIFLTATGVGTSAVSYQWFKGATPLSDGGDISGSATATLTIAHADVTDSGLYRVEITNLSGTLSAGAQVSVFEAPVILDEPIGAVVFVGNSVELYSRTVGVGPLTYQWFKGATPLANGGGISGANGPVLTLTSLQTVDSGSYHVEVANSFGGDISVDAVITVILEPGGFSAGFPTTAGANSQLRAVLPTADGGAYIGGSFSSAGATGANTAVTNAAKLLPDGSVDLAFQPAPNGQVNGFALHQADGVLMGGSFQTIGGQSRGYLARFTTAGAYDTTFNTNMGIGPNSSVNDIVVLPDDKVLIGGFFNNISGTTRYGLARLNADGTHDATFNPPMSTYGNVYDIVLSASGKITVTGSFNISGRQNVARFNSDGTLDTSFSATLDYQGQAIAVQADGKTVVGGFFTKTNGINSGSLVRLNVDGTSDAGFAANASFPSTVNRIAVQSNGRIVVGGSFSSYGGSGRGLVRLLPDGGLDGSFVTGTGWSGSGQTYDIKVAGNGSIWAAGTTNSFNGQLVNALAVFNGDEPSAPPTGPTFASWASDRELPIGLDGPLDDADLDGISNLLEYALGLDPMAADPSELPQAEISGGLLKFTYQRLRADVIYTVETTSDMSGWTASGVDQGTPAPDGTTIASIPVTAAPTFLHLKVVLAP